MAMEIRSIMMFALLTSCELGAEVSRASDLKEEFDISSDWHDGMTWEEFLKIRNESEREALIKYVDKIEQQNMAHDNGLEVPKTYVASREKVPLVELLSSLDAYAVKMTHLSSSEGLILVKKGINMVTGKPISPEQVEESVYKAFSRKPRDVESWALHHVQPGFMIQEYIPDRMEVKIQTIWGRAVIGEWRGGEIRKPATPVFGKYDRDGNLVSNRPESRKTPPSWWPKAIVAAEKMALGTDALRVDFLIRKDGTLLLSELEIWPETNWSKMQKAIEKRLNNGYRAYLSE